MKLAQALSRLMNELEALEVRFALVGGLAASARSEARFTRDVDAAVHVADDSAAEAVIYELTRRAYSLVAVVEQEAVGRMATARLRDPSGVICDLLFATCGIEPEVVASAQLLTVFPGVSVPTAAAEAILAMKVLSVTPARPRDSGDIQSILLHSPELDRQRVAELLGLIESRGFSRGQRLLEKWETLVVSLAP